MMFIYSAVECAKRRRWMQRLITRNPISGLLVVVLALSSAIILPASAQFNLPEETRTCAADSDARSTGIYRGIPLGVSFKHFNELAANMKYKLSSRRDFGGPGYRLGYEYLAVEDWPIGKGTWKPYFDFVNDGGCLKLAVIGGQLPPDFDVVAGVLDTLDSKYGEHIVTEDGTLHWMAGQPTFIVFHRDSRLLTMNQKHLIEVGLDLRKKQTPDL